MSKVDWAGLIILGLMLVLPIAYWVDSHARRYFHFQNMTKHTLIEEVETYVRERTSDQGQYVCLYVVKCDGRNARLERVDDIQHLDFDQVKQTIWKRRFDESYCTGRTTNIGLHLIPQAGHKAQIEATAHARWSFYDDRFIPQWGRFQSGAFTDKPWQKCTAKTSLNAQLKAFGS